MYTFLHEIKSNNTPLIEQCPIDNQYKLITYIWLGDRKTENVYVFGSFPGWDLSVNQLKRLLQTDIWYQTFRTDKSFISTYYFSVNDFFENDWIKRSEQYELDRFNGNTFGEGANKASVLSIGMEVQYSSRFPSNHYPSGKIETHSFHSTILNNTRKIHIYTPHDYFHTSHPQELLIVFDGNSFIKNLSIAKTLNYTTISGFSLGGLAAFYAALQNPHVFGNVLSMSGSVHWKKGGYENQISSIDSNTSQTHFYIAAGELENKPLLTANRRLYKALKGKGYPNTYEEFQGAHDGVWWREKLFDGLKALKLKKTTL
ncbi:alpha/beta hydrolase [Bacillus wiedmannii]|uniref:alpha/beta hydrolase n=1 Tax=Bacillus wiedmannii TaxID=1890302 RepID=UPI001F610551|nr:alpha/beta hydrolase-fold protein [Bacillus wiedmannii]MED3126645.1 alpha/beta hydrolase-fold protein [Bacillus wiedmannii]